MPKRIHKVEPLCSPISGTNAMSLLTEHTFPRHSHDHLGVGVISHGTQCSWSLIGQLEAGPGDVIIVNPGEIHDGIPLRGPRAWKMIYLDPDLLLQELDADGYRSDVLLQPLVRDAQLSQFMLQLFREMTFSSADSCKIEEVLILSLMRLCSHHLLTSRYQSNSSPQIQLAKQCLDDTPESPILLSELAALCGMSQFQLLRGFSREVGTTPHAYLLQLRVRHACRYLAQGKRIAEAALMAGFADQSHLTRAFVRQLGITPARYQKAIL